MNKPIEKYSKDSKVHCTQNKYKCQCTQIPVSLITKAQVRALSLSQAA